MSVRHPGVLFLALFLCRVAFAVDDDGKRTRDFFAKIIEAGNIEDTHARASSLRTTVSEYSDLADKILDPNQAQQILYQSGFDSYLPQDVRKNYLDLLAKTSGLSKLPSILLDSNQAEKFLSQSGLGALIPEDVKSGFLQILAQNPLPPNVASNLLDPNKASQALSQIGLSESAKAKYLELLAKQPLAANLSSGFRSNTLVAEIPDEYLARISEIVDQGMGSVPLSKVPAISQIVSQFSGVKMNGFSKEDIDFLSHGFLQYFDRSPPDIKRRMIAAWLRTEPKAPWNVQLEAILQGAGPGIQKFFQLIGKETPSPEIQEISKTLRSKVRSAPFEEVKKLIETDQGKPLSELYTSFDETALRAGTVGQIHKAVTKDGKNVIVKVLKPGIYKEMDEEMSLLQDIFEPNVAVHQFVSMAKEGFLEECDLLHEKANIDEAVAYIDPKMGLDIPKLDPLVPATRNTLTEEIAPGRNFEDSADLDPRLRIRALKAVATKWLQVALGKGFFHGDLHASNFMLDVQPEGKKLPYLVTYIDWGAAGHLTVQQRQGLMLLYASVEEKNVDEVLKSLETTFSNLPDSDTEKLRSEIQDILATRGRPTRKLNEVVEMAIKEGMKIPDDAAMFARSLFFLTSDIDSVNEELGKKYPQMRVKSSGKILRDAALGDLVKEVWHKITTHTKQAAEGVWDIPLLKKLIEKKAVVNMERIKENCSALFGRKSAVVR
jgi:predicted unusual protein kinase regulating ubiquinone biosynthesis (AarF/ABC1/UbiB family)